MRDRIVPCMTLAVGQIRAGRGSRNVVLEGTTFDRDTRTLTYVLTTDKPCLSFRCRETADGDYELFEVMEVLDPKGCVNLDKIVGLPLVDSHDYSSIRNILGTHMSAKVVGNGIECQARLSARPDVAVLYGDFADGTFNAASVGYNRLKENPPVEDPNGGLPLVLVTEWETNEGSFVVIPADSDAGIRAKRAAARTKEPDMTTTTTPSEPSLADVLKGLSTITDSVRSLSEGLTAVRGKVDNLEKGGKGGSEEDPEGQRDDDMDDMSDDERAKRSKSLDNLRPMAQRCGYAEFDDMAALGTSIKDLKAELRKRMATSGVNIDPNSRGGDHAQRGAIPSTGKARSVADLSLEDSFMGQRMAKYAAITR